MESLRYISLSAVLLSIISGFFLTVSAERFTGGSYTIDASVVGNSFGGANTGGSYTLTSSGGESVIGQGSGGSYKLGSGYVAQLESSLQLTLQPGGMVAYYSLDEPSGSFMRDSSFNSNDGTTSGSPTIGAGKVGNAITLNGTSQYASADDNDIATTITISAWVKPTSTSNPASIIISKHSSVSDIQALMTLSTCSFTINGAAVSLSTRSTLTTGVWTHIVCTYDGSNVAEYINGALRTSSAATGAIATNNYNWTFGKDAASNTNYLDGAIDEVKLFSRALAANEVKAEYDAGAAGNASGLSFATAIIPGFSQTSNYDAAVLTDASNGYNLSVSQNQNLTKGGDSISAVSGSIASPVSWVEGTTKGLGFTLFGTNATAIDGKWSSGSAYAAFPGSATSYYVRSGKPTSKDVLNMRLRLDVPTSQVSGTYTNVITTTGTITP